LLPPPSPTRRSSDLLHLLHWPFGHVHLPDMAGKVGFARFLHDGSQVRCSEIDPDQKAMNTIPGGQPPGTLTLNLPTAQPPVAVPVIELFLTTDGMAGIAEDRTEDIAADGMERATED